MDLRHLQALIGIADTGSFSAAAEAIGTVQSNVSAHVARLERELEVVLVERSTGRLTSEGEVVVARARRMVAELDAMVADVLAMRHDVRGTVRVGMIGTTGRWLVPQLVRHLRQQHPLVHMVFVDGTSTTLEPRLVSGQLDLAVVTLPVPNDELSASALFEEDLMLVVPAEHPLAKSREAPVPLSELGQLELILPLPGTALRDEIDAAVQPAGIVLRASLELDGLRMIASLVFDGFGPAILPATAVPAHLREDYASLPLEGFPRRRVGVAVRSRGLPSAPTRVVIELLSQMVEGPERLPPGLHPALASPRR